MDIEELKIVLEKWQKTLSDIDKSFAELNAVIGINPDSPLGYAVEMIQGEYTKAIASIVSDKTDLLSWYWLENDMGNKCSLAGFTGDMRNICNIEDLATLLIDYRNADLKRLGSV